jgi:CRISPR-associated protein Csb1
VTIPVSEILARPRFLVEAQLHPLQGSRIQPTGFPNLGAAEFQGPDGVSMLIVESAQSMANRLEAIVWDDAVNELVAPLRGMPYVRTDVDGTETDSIREAHRLNSPYLGAIHATIRERAGIKADGSNAVDRQKLAAAVFYYDPNAIIHGVFLEKITGLARLTRSLSAFIEASGARLVTSGGVKNDRVDTTGKLYGGAAAGFGNIPFARSEYSADHITAYFSLDSALLHSYRLGEPAERFIALLSLWKIAALLESGLRLRTACDLEPTNVTTNIAALDVFPARQAIEAEIPASIAACAAAGLFADPPTTTVEFAGKKSKKP